MDQFIKISRESGVSTDGKLINGTHMEINGSIQDLAFNVSTVLELDHDANEIIKRAVAIYVHRTGDNRYLHEILDLLDFFDSKSE